MKYTLVTFTLLLAITPANATGRYKCEPVTEDKWLTDQQLSEKLTSLGWEVDRMKKDGGCWEVYGDMPDGTRVEGYFHPETGEALFISQRGKVIFQK